MPTTDLLQQARRMMVICNWCRYCEGFCAVFPAMILRRDFPDPDLKYLANLCHNCRDCYYACQYAPPHTFAVNVPKTFAELRLSTYRDFTWPGFLAGLFHRNGRAVAWITSSSTAILFLLAMVWAGPATVFSAHLGPDAFYEVIPRRMIILPASFLGLYSITALLMGLAAFWRETGGHAGELMDLRAHACAARDVLQLKYLDGGGFGCNYPDARFSRLRRWFHHLVFYGFMLCFAATTVAGIYDHFPGWKAPYPFWSWPVVLGTAGGSSLLIGSGALIYLKRRMDPAPAASLSFGMDMGFLAQLFLTALTGLLLLALRETPAMGTLLIAHLGLVTGLFISLPYGKSVHAIYRYAALVRNAIEKFREETQIKKV
ncbi:MAG: tricarballylate utilization 4Fe-4S protein TcuB [Desulfobacterales bacterium]|nr:tricarballylate utilization 4Fe-4S protein TcuB [Desulfobacterales bacterium]